MNDTIKADLLENAPVIIAFHDREHNLLWANAAYRKATGFSLEEIKGKKCFSVWGLSRPCRNCTVTSAIDTGEPAEAELTPRNQDHWPEAMGSWLSKSAPIRNKDGEIIGAIEVSYNITEMKKSEDELQLSEEKYRMVVENAAEGIILLDAKGKILEINNRTLQISGLKREEVMGRYFWKLLPAIKMNITDVIGAFKDIVLGKRVGMREWPLINKSGKKVVIQAHASLVKENGTIQGISVILEDITERVQSEKELEKHRQHLEELVEARTRELKQSEERFRTIFESSKDAIMMLAPPGWLFVSGNKATIEMFRAKNEKEFLSKNPWELSPEYQPDGQLSSEKASMMIEQAMKTGSNFFEWTHKRFDGKNFIASVLLSSVKLQGKKLLQAITRDITARKKIEEDLKEKLKELEIFYEAAVDRELRMEELRKEIKELKKASDRKTE